MRDILFDLDGTLIHSFPGIELALLATLDALGRPPLRREALLSVVGLPLNRVFQALLGDDDPDAERAVPIYRSLYLERGLPLARPFDGVPAVLAALARPGRRVFVVTARNETVARGMVESHGLAAHFEEVRGERLPLVESKGAMVADLLDRHGLDPRQTVVVGDRRFDAEAARVNRCEAVGAGWGYGGAEELREAGVSLIAAEPADLLSILR